MVLLLVMVVGTPFQVVAVGVNSTGLGFKNGEVEVAAKRFGVLLILVFFLGAGCLCGFL